MICPSTLTCSRYADGALDTAEARTFETHLAGCARCQALVESLAAESLALRSAMHAAGAGGVIPAFVPRPTIGRLLSWLVWLALAAWAVNATWMSLASPDVVPAWLGWLAPDSTGIGIGLVIGLLVSLLTKGGELVSAFMQLAGWLALAGAAVAAAGALLRRVGRQAETLCLTLAAAAVLITTAVPVQAFEIRRDEDRVTIAADEVIDDTLVILSENVIVEGTVNGDLIALGETVTIRGRVDGNLIAGAEALVLEGDVSGSVLAMGEAVDVRSERLGANLFAMGEAAAVHPTTEITGNAVLMAQDAELHGTVGRDLITLAEQFTLFGSVQGGLSSYGEKVTLTSTARVGADLNARVKSSDHLRIADGARVAGDTKLDGWPERPNPYLTFEHYLGEVLKLLAALVAGLVLFQVFPALGRVRVDNGAALLTAGGIGAVALVATPILALLAAITLIGLPLALCAFLLWLIGLYLAGIVSAGVVGRLLLEDRGHALTLAAGLFILFVLINIPILGGLVRLVAVLAGLGLIVAWLRDLWRQRSSAA